MYGIDWIEQLKLRTARIPALDRAVRVSPTVLKLGYTSLLTDISAEMVNSMLPVYLVLHLHMNPLQFGAVDGVYNGMAVVLFSLAGGFLADRLRRPKEVAAFGYGLSAICKLLLLGVGGAWGWITAIVAMDRTGKGLRTAPRDGLISLHSPGDSMATAFAVHRALDAGGSLLGPVAAFAILAAIPGAFDAVWIISFVFAVLGWSILWLFVQNPSGPRPAGGMGLPRLPAGRRLIADRRFWALVAVGALLSVATVSDAFLYLLLQQRTNLNAGFFPLFYVITAFSYMLFSIPVGTVADAWGRGPVLLFGYTLIGAIYAFLLGTEATTLTGCIACLLLFGLHYAATEGVLAAMTGDRIPADFRSSGLAVLATAVGSGKLISSLLFGWLWHTRSATVAISTFAGALVLALLLSAICLRGTAEKSSA